MNLYQRIIDRANEETNEKFVNRLLDAWAEFEDGGNNVVLFGRPDIVENGLNLDRMYAVAKGYACEEIVVSRQGKDSFSVTIKPLPKLSIPDDQPIVSTARQPLSVDGHEFGSFLDVFSENNVTTFFDCYLYEDNPFGVSPDLLVNVSYGWKVQTFTVVDSVTKKYIISMSDSAFKDYYQKDESV